jgi:hypothetical protein
MLDAWLIDRIVSCDDQRRKKVEWEWDLPLVLALPFPFIIHSSDLHENEKRKDKRHG